MEVGLFDCPHTVRLLLLVLSLCFYLYCYVLVPKRIQVLQLLLHCQLVELQSLHLQQILSMLSYHIYYYARSVVRQIHRQRITVRCVHVPFARYTVKNIPISLLRYLLATAASVVEFLPRNVNRPATRIKG